MRRYAIVEIEDVQEAFCGVRRKNMVALSDAEPEIAEEWCYKQNAGWGPEHFSRGSGVRCWWECPACKRPYKAQINNRTSAMRSACPYCASKKVCCDNALSDLFPEVSKEWHPTKNKKLKPCDVTYASTTKVWWLCGRCNHAWQAVISCRTVSHSGCPACYETRMEEARAHPQRKEQIQIVLSASSKNISRAWYEIGERRFETLAKGYPAVAKQWHPIKNGEWTPADFAAGSETIAWWKCTKGPDHEWQAPIYSRTGSRKGGCPFCSGKRVSVTNSLKHMFREVAAEWHPTLNGSQKPQDYTAGSGQKVWWQCKNNAAHEWETLIHLRAGGSKCPKCSFVKVGNSFHATGDNSLAAKFPHIAAQLHPTKNGNLNPNEVTFASSKRLWWVCPIDTNHEWQTRVSNRTKLSSGCPDCYRASR